MKNLLLILMMVSLPTLALGETDSDSVDATEKELRDKGVNPDDPAIKVKTDGSMTKSGGVGFVPKVSCEGCAKQMPDGQHNEYPDEFQNETQKLLSQPQKKAD